MSRAGVRTGVRIGAGKLKGRRLDVPRGVRPTEGRVREALFDIVGPAIAGARVVDLFAGSGAVGIEALSRGAARALLVEGSLPQVRGLVRLHRSLQREDLAILRARLPAELPKVAAVWADEADLVFADPPYDFATHERLLAGARPLLAVDGLLVVEHRRGVTLPAAAGGLRRVEERRYGESALSLYRLAAE